MVTLRLTDFRLRSQHLLLTIGGILLVIIDFLRYGLIRTNRRIMPASDFKVVPVPQLVFLILLSGELLVENLSLVVGLLLLLLKMKDGFSLLLVFFARFVALGVEELGLLAGAWCGFVDVQHEIRAATRRHILELEVVIADDIIIGLIM